MANRDAWKERLERLGATVKNSVSSKTDVLLVGAAPGQNKLEDARKHGIPTLWFPLAEYLELFEESRTGPGIETVSEEVISQLAIIMSKVTEELYVSAQLGSKRHQCAYYGAARAVRALLVGAYGDVIEGVGGRNT